VIKSALYMRVRLRNHAHMDSFIGPDAAKDVVPTIITELDRAN
jgi:hypothetical protein